MMDMLYTRCLLYFDIPPASSRISLVYRRRGLYERYNSAAVGIVLCVTLNRTLLACGTQDEEAEDREQIV